MQLPAYDCSRFESSCASFPKSGFPSPTPLSFCCDERGRPKEASSQFLILGRHHVLHIAKHCEMHVVLHCAIDTEELVNGIRELVVHLPACIIGHVSEDVADASQPLVRVGSVLPPKELETSKVWPMPSVIRAALASMGRDHPHSILYWLQKCR